ncbi:MAG: 2-oxo-hepta-3-ene-1,7-dioic acid hydratase [Alphaproteobacteria bacterium]|jgi:2-oxo-hept-3-ene-1,7-dioate hydratase|nr:2-oxo-hepta-3-ene-1,7-dioic acid hydratase [Alphaproteobacteria bacterium]MBT4018731.1 2-oxo-hepta-3-ene-1,7-dioic acid hydratase [Alphaproteobacteria bacterium]MBT5162060.1 2-oxo-hepta-3-ene-1,7-dioic acid hydratase [Alphaproteobacteria bacterium]MBT5918293.1 2-oxo-hepta-3-ene-1,7-dioic acid hydratase [Alphaproteobacteria bacterium]MBT6386784.1 2-oxo-hepta-3-ene-1,7-dioic acid hydratase [Alphaproteobacteria bacterium]
MLDKNQISEIALKLKEAEVKREQIGHITLAYPEITIEDAYAVQRELVALKCAEGRKIVGHKIGLTSRAMQMSVGINEPDYGALLDDMVFEEGSDIPHDRFVEPRLEVELAFILKDRLEGPGVTITDVLSATDYILPALEIIDARILRNDPETGASRKVMDTISDNASNAGVVLGGRPVKADAIDLRWVSALLFQNGVIEETGVSAGVLNHPAKGVAWLANKYAAHKIGLEPGQIILSGSFTRPVFVHPGDTLHADYGPLGSIACRFV